MQIGLVKPSVNGFVIMTETHMCKTLGRRRAKSTPWLDLRPLCA